MFELETWIIDDLKHVVKLEIKLDIWSKLTLNLFAISFLRFVLRFSFRYIHTSQVLFVFIAEFLSLKMYHSVNWNKERNVWIHLVAKPVVLSACLIVTDKQEIRYCATSWRDKNIFCCKRRLSLPTSQVANLAAAYLRFMYYEATRIITTPPWMGC